MTVSFANAEILRCAQNDAVVHRCISKQRAGHFDRLNDRPGTAVQWLGATSTGGPRTVIEWRLKQSGSRCIEMTVACANAEITRSAQNDGVVDRCVWVQPRPAIFTHWQRGVLVSSVFAKKVQSGYAAGQKRRNCALLSGISAARCVRKTVLFDRRYKQGIIDS